MSVAAEADSRKVSLTIPAKPDYLVLARLALSAVCRLTPLSAEEVADLKLAITEAATDYVDEDTADSEERLTLSFRLLEDRLLLQLDGSRAGPGPAGEHGAASEQELAHAIIEATVDECEYGAGETRLVKYLGTSDSDIAR